MTAPKPCVYTLTNKENGLVYVGESADLKSALAMHEWNAKTRESAFYRDLRFHGMEGFAMEVFPCTVPELKKKKLVLIAAHRGRCYNREGRAQGRPRKPHVKTWTRRAIDKRLRQGMSGKPFAEGRSRRRDTDTVRMNWKVFECFQHSALGAFGVRPGDDYQIKVNAAYGTDAEHLRVYEGIEHFRGFPRTPLSELQCKERRERLASALAAEEHGAWWKTNEYFAWRDRETERRLSADLEAWFAEDERWCSVASVLRVSQSKGAQAKAAVRAEAERLKVIRASARSRRHEHEKAQREETDKYVAGLWHVGKDGRYQPELNERLSPAEVAEQRAEMERHKRTGKVAVEATGS